MQVRHVLVKIPPKHPLFVLYKKRKSIFKILINGFDTPEERFLRCQLKERFYSGQIKILVLKKIAEFIKGSKIFQQRYLLSGGIAPDIKALDDKIIERIRGFILRQVSFTEYFLKPGPNFVFEEYNNPCNFNEEEIRIAEKIMQKYIYKR
jgi:hypothetical protein